MKILRALFNPFGGIHPRYNKGATASLPVETMPAPARLVVSLTQHLGAPSKPLVKKGDVVSRGQPIAEAGGFVSSWVHAPVSGTVKAVGPMPTASGKTAMAVEIESDGQDRAWEQAGTGLPDWKAAPAKQLVEMVAKAGIVGMGGAGFPTHVKLSPPEGKKIDTLIINGAECEPYLTADHRLMVEQAGRIWTGTAIIRHILGAQRVRVAIEDNKPDAVAAMEKAMRDADGDVEIVTPETRYPQGAEKQLIYSVTGRQVPSGGLPMDVGALVENVGTAAAIADAVTKGMPLTERVVTVTGPAVKNPRNVLAKIGTTFADLAAFCGGFDGEPGKLICGGPMMGVTQASAGASVGKTTSGLLALPPGDVVAYSSMPCISCGRCVTACPMKLLPCTLSENLEAERYEEAEALDVLDCIECGCCAFECPAHRPLVQHMRQGKNRVVAMRKQREAARAEKVEKKQ